MVALNFCQAQEEINIQQQINVLGQTKPVPVSLEGFTGEAAEVLKFDLYVQGFSFVTPDIAQYRIIGSNTGNVQGYVTDRISRQTKFSRSYTGASLRRQAHAFADDIVLAITGKKGIGQTKIAFKAQAPSGNGEIYVSDFDGHNAQAVTHDNAIVAAPAWSARTAGALLHILSARQPGYFLPQPCDRTAPHHRQIFRLEHERGGFAGRLEGGDDFEPERQPERLGMQRGRHGFQAIDVVAGGRVIAVLVAGRAVDLFRDQNQVSAGCWRKFRRAAARCSGFPLRAYPIRPTRTGRRTANGSRSRRRWVTSTSASCRRAAASPRCWCRASIRRGRRTRARWS